MEAVAKGTAGARRAVSVEKGGGVSVDATCGAAATNLSEDNEFAVSRCSYGFTCLGALSNFQADSRL